jgi:hypothetical protein
MKSNAEDYSQLRHRSRALVLGEVRKPPAELCIACAVLRCKQNCAKHPDYSAESSQITVSKNSKWFVTTVLKSETDIEQEVSPLPALIAPVPP